MENSVKIYLKNDFILICLDEEAKYSVIYNDLKLKLINLKKFYEKNNLPIIITGKYLQEKQQEQLKNLFFAVIGINIQFKYNDNSLGLHNINKIHENNDEYSSTKFYEGSLRSGMKVQSKGSLVILGDVNSGSEVIAGGNIIVMGILRGLAHAGADGDIKAFITCNEVDTKQIRIANIIRTKDVRLKKDKFVKIFIKDDNIAIV